MGTPCSIYEAGMFLFSVVSWAWIRVSQHTFTGYWLCKGPEPCVNLFYFSFSPGWSSSSLTVVSQNGLFHLWLATSGNLYSHCAEIHPLNVIPTDSHSALWDSREHKEQFSPCYFLFWKFQVYRKVKGTVQLIHIYFYLFTNY